MTGRAENGGDGTIAELWQVDFCKDNDGGEVLEDKGLTLGQVARVGPPAPARQ